MHTTLEYAVEHWCTARIRISTWQQPLSVYSSSEVMPLLWFIIIWFHIMWETKEPPRIVISVAAITFLTNYSCILSLSNWSRSESTMKVSIIHIDFALLFAVASPTSAFIPLIDGGKGMPKLYDGWFNDQISKQAASAVGRAVAARRWVGWEDVKQNRVTFA